MNKPPLGLTTKVHFTRVVDSDTIEVELRRKFKVRIKDLLCEEKYTPSGLISKKFAQSLFNSGDIVTLHIPHTDEKLLSPVSFDRLVGTIWMPNSGNYGDIIVNSGYGRWLRPNEKGHMGI